MTRTIISVLMTMTIMVSGPMRSQQYSGNIFDASGDIGNCGIKGASDFLTESQEYTLTGSGNNIWFGSDQFHFAWKKMKGDFILNADVRADDHPFYRHVYIRKMEVPKPKTGQQCPAGQTPEVIAYLYGGHGTINVPGWSPDGRKVAIVSNSGSLCN